MLSREKLRSHIFIYIKASRGSRWLLIFKASSLGEWMPRQLFVKIQGTSWMESKSNFGNIKVNFNRTKEKLKEQTWDKRHRTVCDYLLATNCTKDSLKSFHSMVEDLLHGITVSLLMWFDVQVDAWENTHCMI